MPTTLKVLGSLLLVAAVLWWMWRLPKSGQRFFFIAPAMALLSVWFGIAAIAVSIALWFVNSPDNWLPVSFLALDPATITLAVLVLWIYRGYSGMEQTIDDQCTQAKTAIVLGLIAVAIGYLFVLTHKTPFT